MSISKKVSSIVNLLKKKNKQINKIKTQYQQIFDFDQSQRKIHTCLLVIIIQFQKKKKIPKINKKEKKKRTKQISSISTMKYIKFNTSLPPHRFQLLNHL